MTVDEIKTLIESEIAEHQARADAAFRRQVSARNGVAREGAIADRNMAQGQANALRKVLEKINAAQ